MIYAHLYFIYIYDPTNNILRSVRQRSKDLSDFTLGLSSVLTQDINVPPHGNTVS